MTRLLTPKALAEHFGVSRSTVTRWIQRGRVALDEQGLIDADMAAVLLRRTQALAPQHQARIAAHDMQRQARGLGLPADGQEQAAAPWMPDADDVAARYKAAMAREREAKAELAAMEVDRLAGLLLDRQEVDFVLADLGNTLRIKLEQAEDVLTEAVLPLRGDAAAIRQAVRETLREVLDDLAELMKRRMQEVTT